MSVYLNICLSLLRNCLTVSDIFYADLVKILCETTPTCDNHRVLYHPCNKRGCPTCSKKNQLQWKEKYQKKILPMGHFHLIFSVPEVYVYIWMKLKRDFINSFFHLVQESFKNYQKQTGLKYGLTMVFQSHGRGLCYKPHMHCLLTPGGIDENGKWHDDNSISYSELLEGIKNSINAELCKKVKKLERATLRNIISVQDEKEWRYNVTFHKKSGDNIISYLARSAGGMVVDIEKEVTQNAETKKVKIKQLHLGKLEETELDFDDFRERYFNHIPPKGSVMVRNYGLYSNRYKKELEKIRKELLKEKDEEYKEEEEEYIEACPECHTPLEVQQIFTYTELPKIILAYETRFRAPPEDNAILD